MNLFGNSKEMVINWINRFYMPIEKKKNKEIKTWRDQKSSPTLSTQFKRSFSFHDKSKLQKRQPKIGWNAQQWKVDCCV